MAIERKIVEIGLQQKGFRKDDRDHHFFIYWAENGKKTSIMTKTSHGSAYKTLGDNLVSQMARQCNIPTQSFLDLINCPLSRTDYENDLKERNIIQLGEEKIQMKNHQITN